jgi:hypothetical protein
MEPEGSLYRVHKSPPLAPILTPMNLISTIPSYFSKIDPNIILLPSLGLRSSLFLSDFSTKTLYAFLLSPKRATCHDTIKMID